MPRKNFTPKLIEFSGLLLCGLTNKEAANVMRISPRTVKGYIRDLCTLFSIPDDRMPRICLAAKIHEQRHILGVACPCDL